MALTLTVNKQKEYVDLDLDFFAMPSTYDVSVKTGDEAVKRSIRNLIFTNYYDRPMQPNIGSNVWKLLFENATPFTAVMLEDAIRTTVENFEPRVTMRQVKVEPDYDNNGFNVTMVYSINNRQEPVTTSMFLERIR